MAMALNWFGLLIGLSSISAWPGDQLLLAEAGSTCVFGAPRRGFGVLRRSWPAVTLRCARQERIFACAPTATRD